MNKILLPFQGEMNTRWTPDEKQQKTPFKKKNDKIFIHFFFFFGFLEEKVEKNVVSCYTSSYVLMDPLAISIWSENGRKCWGKTVVLSSSSSSSSSNFLLLLRKFLEKYQVESLHLKYLNHWSSSFSMIQTNVHCRIDQLSVVNLM